MTQDSLQFTIVLSLRSRGFSFSIFWEVFTGGSSPPCSSCCFSAARGARSTRIRLRQRRALRSRCDTELLLVPLVVLLELLGRMVQVALVPLLGLLLMPGEQTERDHGEEEGNPEVPSRQEFEDRHPDHRFTFRMFWMRRSSAAIFCSSFMCYPFPWVFFVGSGIGENRTPDRGIMSLGLTILPVVCFPS